MQAVRISLLAPMRSSKEKMALVRQVNAKFPILNVDKIEVAFASGQWSVSSEVELSATPPAAQA
jgi:hypothetical protein